MLRKELFPVEGNDDQNPYTADVALFGDHLSLVGFARVVPPFSDGENILRGIEGNRGIVLQRTVSNSDATILSIGYPHPHSEIPPYERLSYDNKEVYEQAVADIRDGVKELINLLGALANTGLFQETAAYLEGVLLCDNEFDFRER